MGVFLFLKVTDPYLKLFRLRKQERILGRSSLMQINSEVKSTRRDVQEPDDPTQRAPDQRKKLIFEEVVGAALELFRNALPSGAVRLVQLEQLAGLLIGPLERAQLRVQLVAPSGLTRSAFAEASLARPGYRSRHCFEVLLNFCSDNCSEMWSQLTSLLESMIESSSMSSLSGLLFWSSACGESTLIISVQDRAIVK